MAIKDEIRARITEVVRRNAKEYTDKALLEVIKKEVGVVVSMGFLRKLRQGLGLLKVPGRGVCRLLKDAANLSVNVSVNSPTKVEVNPDVTVNSNVSPNTNVDVNTNIGNNKGEKTTKESIPENLPDKDDKIPF